MPRPVAVLVLLAVLSAALVGAGLGACKRTPRDAGPGRVTIVYTGGVQGALEPCGCSPGQLGGVGRLATLVGQIRKENPDTIFVDAGDLLLQDPEAAGSMRAQLVLKAKSMQKAYGAMRASVVNVGGKDVAAGIEVAVGGTEAIGAAPISANLVGPGGKPLTQGSALIEAGGVRVAFVGVAQAGRQKSRPPLEAVRAAVEGVRSRADVVVLLSTLGLRRPAISRRRIPGIDFVIDAGEGKDPRNIVIPLKAGGARLVSVKPLGEFVGRIDIALDAAKGGPLHDATASDRIEGMPAAGGASGTLFGGGLDLRGCTADAGRRPDAAARPGTFRHRVRAERSIRKDPSMAAHRRYKRQVAGLTSKMVIPVAHPDEGPALPEM
jgi:2',3'-cyclic-nucleotide 2'-phosphodiesterase (5'-nucleotidase family)